MEKDIKNTSYTARDLLNGLLDIPTQNLNSVELKLLRKCRLNALELFKDILIISEKIEARKKSNRINQY